MSRTSCMTDSRLPSLLANHDLMVQRFTKAMAKMTVLGNDVRKLYDCSEVIPVPKPAASKVAHLPAGKSLKDIEHACKATPFPTIRADPGASLSLSLSSSPDHIGADTDGARDRPGDVHPRRPSFLNSPLPLSSGTIGPRSYNGDPISPFIIAKH